MTGPTVLAPSAGRLGVLALALYLTLDCANPLMAGAVRFELDECVEAVTHARPAPPVATLAAPRVPVPARTEPLPPHLLRRAVSPPPPTAGATLPPRAALARVADVSPDDD